MGHEVIGRSVMGGSLMGRSVMYRSWTRHWISHFNGGAMDRRSLENMKLDRRLIKREGWISEEELQRQLEALPDVADKVASDDEEASDEGAESAGSESTGEFASSDAGRDSDSPVS